jgi:hypothetical protein
LTAAEDRAVVFLHIGKTAGSTLHRILRRHYPAELTYVIPTGARAERIGSPRETGGAGRSRTPREKSLERFAALPAERRAQLRLVLGHTVFGIHELLPGPATYLTLLRDPLRLVPSQYRYISQTRGHRLHDAVGRMTLAEYVRSGVSINANNSQTRAVAGDLDTPFGSCDEELLLRAQRNIEQHFAVVGLTERFDDSLLLMRQAFGWTRLHYVRAKVSRGPAQAPLSDDERAAILELNELDVRLYRWAAERFEQALAALPDLDAERRRLARRNAVYRPLGTLSQTLPARAGEVVRGLLRTP